MKKFLIAFLGIAFLLPAYVSASSYCVSFPTSGNSMWTKRDNNVGARFRYDSKQPGGRSDIADTDYAWYGYGSPDLCLEDDNLRSARGLKDAHVRLDVKWGGDCEKVSVGYHSQRERSYIKGGDHRFQIYRRKDDHVNPWGCKRK